MDILEVSRWCLGPSSLARAALASFMMSCFRRGVIQNLLAGGGATKGFLVFRVHDYVALCAPHEVEPRLDATLTATQFCAWVIHTVALGMFGWGCSIGGDDEY